MDVDRYIATNEPAWFDLESLTNRARRRRAPLAPAEVEQFVQRYQQVSGHLSFAQTHFPQSALTARLSRIVGNASAVLYGAPPRPAHAVVGFFGATFPAAVWHIRRFIAVSAMLTLLPALVLGVWMANSPSSRDALISHEAQDALVASQFADYYSSEPAAAFSTKVLVNNIQVSFLAFAAGVLLCVVTGFVLVFNGANIGLTAGVMYAGGGAATFWGLILPHGLLELSAIVIAGAAGFTLGWAVIAPGDVRRSSALAAAARRSVTILLGLMVAFVVAGLIEGFVTPSGLPTAARVGLGAAVFAAFWTYALTRGRVAAAHGLTGAMGERR